MKDKLTLSSSVVHRSARAARRNQKGASNAKTFSATNCALWNPDMTIEMLIRSMEDNDTLAMLASRPHSSMCVWKRDALRASPARCF